MTAVSGRASRPRSFRRFVLDLIDGFREAREISARYQQLAHLSDPELAARKLRREELPRIAMRGRP
jgi:hypothetical protein